MPHLGILQLRVSCETPDTEMDNCPKAIPLGSLELPPESSFIAVLQGSTVLVCLGRLGFNSV